MSNSLSGFTVEPEPERNTLTLRVTQLVLDTPDVIDQIMPAIVAGFAALDWQPCYILLDISGLTLAPRIRTYFGAQGHATTPLVRALVVFSRRPNPVTELLLRAGAGYDQVPYAYYEDEAAARADIARRQAQTSGQ